MLTHAKRYLFVAALLAMLAPAMANAEESDYDYWTKGATAGSAYHHPSHLGSRHARGNQPSPYYPEMHRAPANVYGGGPDFIRSPQNPRGWTYDYD